MSTLSVSELEFTKSEGLFFRMEDRDTTIELLRWSALVHGTRGRHVTSDIPLFWPLERLVPRA